MLQVRIVSKDQSLKNKPRLTARIHKVSQTGVVEIKFSRILNESAVVDGIPLMKNLSMLNSSYISIYVEPSMAHANHSLYNVSDLYLTWSTLSLKGDMLKIQLNFSEPEKLSPYKPLDKVHVLFF